MVILDTLLCRKVVVNQRSSNALNLVCAYRGTDTAAADRHSTLDFLSGYRSGQHRYIVRIVITFVQLMSTEIDNLMSCGAELWHQLFLQAKSAVINGNPHTHVYLRELVTNVTKI